MHKTILLISLNRHHVPYPVYPLGISYLKAYLNKHLPEKYDIEIIDCNISDDALLEEKIRSLSPSYIGFSMRNVDGANSLDRTNFINEYARIIKSVKEHTDAVTIIGGSAFSIYPKELFESISPHYGIIGEGELSLLKLVTKLERGETPYDIEGLVYRDSAGQCVCNMEHTSYIPDFELEYEESSLDYYWTNSGVLNIQTKRGCPYNCIYCTYPLIDGRKIRTFSPVSIVDKLVELKHKHNIDYVFFTDSVFNIKNEYNIELAKEIIARGLKIRWGGYFSPSNLTDSMLELFAKSGLTHIEFGTESLSNTQLKNYGKNFTVDDVVKVSQLCLKHNIYYAHFLILGGYGETWQTIEETMANSRKLGYTVFFPYYGMRIYKGTKLQQIAIAKGIISKDDNLMEPTYYIEEGMDLERIREMARATGKAWIFPDDSDSHVVDEFRKKRKKKGLLWEYLRKP